MTPLQQAIAAVKQYAQQQTLPTRATTTLFRQLLPDTLEKATRQQADGTYFVATGDLPAMWLRDATFQMWPYVELIPVIPSLKPIVLGMLKRELRYLAMDPYANAFNETASGAHWAEDETNVPVSDWVWERKFEVDSLLAPLLLGERIRQVTGSHAHYDEEFWATYRQILSVLEREQHHETSPYYFRRRDCLPNDTLPREGRGSPVGWTGLIWTGFRPSDNTSVLGYHIPDNWLARTLLRQLTPLIPTTAPDLKSQSQRLLASIHAGLQRYATTTTAQGETILAYEVDGLGHTCVMDDANVPSLLALPYFSELPNDDPLYLATRKWILSEQNPYYYHEQILSGIGSEHTLPHYIWPLSLALEGLTARTIEEQCQKLQQIATTHAGTGQCHEGIDGNDVTQYTREWFSWANMMYCQLALHVLHQQVGG